MSAMQPIKVEEYEKQRKRGIADRVQEHDRMYEQLRQERARMITESEVRMVEVRRQAEQDRLRYSEQMHLREAEIHRLRHVMQKVDKNALPSQNPARLADEELARENSLNATAMVPAATPPQHIGGPHLPPNAPPRWEV